MAYAYGILLLIAWQPGWCWQLSDGRFLLITYLIFLMEHMHMHMHMHMHTHAHTHTHMHAHTDMNTHLGHS